MGNLQVGFIDGQVIIKEDVDVDTPVGVGDWSQETGVRRFLLATQLTLYLLGGFEELAGGESCLHEDDTIEESVC
jgi:hypothetical protein